VNLVYGDFLPICSAPFPANCQLSTCLTFGGQSSYGGGRFEAKSRLFEEVCGRWEWVILAVCINIGAAGLIDEVIVGFRKITW
jgi:hypothetical protein